MPPNYLYLEHCTMKLVPAVMDSYLIPPSVTALEVNLSPCQQLDMTATLNLKL